MMSKTKTFGNLVKSLVITLWRIISVFENYLYIDGASWKNSFVSYLHLPVISPNGLGISSDPWIHISVFACKLSAAARFQMAPSFIFR